MQYLPKALTELIEALGTLPGVGPRTAERYAYHLVKQSHHSAQKLSDSLANLHSGIAYCPKTYALISPEEKISPLYDSPSRNKKVVAVVAEPFDIIAIEKTGQFKGTYHVLGGLISPIDGVGPDSLHITELVKRIEEDEVEEIILATNANVEGESTALYIQKQLENVNIEITRLARGLPIGVDLEYADQITLGRALEGRTAL